MGVLDEAIREHLELKRKHGAPEEELRRQEEDALGPVRREVTSPEEVEVGGDGELAAEAEDEQAEHAAEPAEALAEPGETAGPASFDAETSVLAEPEPELEPFPEEEAPAVPQADEPSEPLPEPEAAEVPEDLPPLDEPSLGGDGRTEPAVEDDETGDEPAAEEERGRTGDVLEDTPDFLEETPEHDRLWFEQKPPRDFDFD
jgi:hypothetical protein